MINVQLSGAAKTVLLTLKARADEHGTSGALLEDEWSADWIQFVPDKSDFMEWYNEPFQLATVIRSRLIDDLVAGYMKSMDNPHVVELGAGLSTRYYRLGEPDGTWIEQDLPEVIRVRRKIDRDSDDHWFLGVDIAQDENWTALLPEADPENTIFIAEASLMFMDEETVKALFATLSEQYAGAAFVFDVVNPGYVEAQGEAFAEMKAPIQWSIVESQLSQYPVDVEEVAYLLLEFPERWDDIDVERGARSKDRSGFVVSARVK